MKFIEKYNINNNKNRIISVLSILIFLINIMLPTTVHAYDTTGNYSYKVKKNNSKEVTIKDIKNTKINTGKGKVTIAASDSSGKVNDIYNSEEGKETRYDKFIKNEFDNEYKLFGQSYADIKFSGEKLNYIKYQILKSDSNPTTMPSDGWSEITAEDDGVNDDIDISEAGKLTQKAYSVFHMKELNSEGYNRDDWKKRELVYKYPFDGVRYVDASVAERKEDYTKKREIINPVTNLPEEIWEPQKVFTKTFDYTGENYKEASKTWGYFKAPESGFYNFGTHSDDGIRFTITNHEGTNLLIDNFEPHGPTFDIATKSVKLEKDKYYPVFIEYFNVGGAAEYGVKYAISDKENMTHPYESYKYVDPGSFFPSKSTAPGESSDGSFEGEGKIMFPEEEGKYYVAYRGFNKDDKNEELVKEGFYGPFIVEDRFTLERIVENNSANSANDFRVKYKIIPKDIRVTDVYKTKEELKEGNVKESLEIKNMYLKDTIPDGIVVDNIYVETEDVKITTNVDEKNSTIDVRFGVEQGETTTDPIGIKYGLNREPNEGIEKAIYKSNPIIVTLDISANSAKEYVFENKKGKLLYNDISLKDEKIMKESYFGETRFELRDNGSIGIKHINYTPNEPTVGEVIDVNYEIVTKPFKAVTKAKTDEIVLVLDASSSMAGDKIEKLKLDAKEFIQKFRTLNNNPKPGSIIANNTKMSIIVYSDVANINPATGDGVSKMEILLDKYDTNLERIIDEIKILPSAGENSGEALRKSEYVLTHPDRSDKSANKTIIMMSDGLATNYSVDNNDKYYTEINNENPKIKGTNIESDENIAKSTEYAKIMGNIIKEKGYSIYTIGHGLDDPKINGNMKDIHYSMGGLNSTLFSGDDKAVDKILEKMQYADYQRQSYIFKDIELKVTSGDGFTEVDGFGASDNKSHIIKIPEIKYVLNETTKQYESAPIPMKFKIKADKPGTYPVFNPTSKNRLEYTDFDGERVSMQVPNPEIRVTDNIYEGIKHGLYEGVSGNNISIIENDSTVIAGGTNVNFGATFVSKSNVPKITLTVDKAIESKEIKNMKVYKIKGNKLEEIKDAKIIPTTHKNIYDIVLPAEIPKDTTILIRYSAKLPISKNVSYTNNIKVGVSEKEIKVTTTNVEEKDRLPDLF